MSRSNTLYPATENAAREPRIGKLFLAQMWSGRMAEHQIIIRNVSRSGISARSRGMLPHLEEDVVIRLAGYGQVTGTVRWILGLRFGVQLDSIVEPHTFSFTDKHWNNVTRVFDYTQFEDEFRRPYVDLE